MGSISTSASTARTVPAFAFSLLSIAMIPLFFILCTCQSGEALPFFGSLLSSLGGSGTSDGTSLLQLLVLEHLQDKLDNFAELANITIGLIG